MDMQNERPITVAHFHCIMFLFKYLLIVSDIIRLVSVMEHLISLDILILE